MARLGLRRPRFTSRRTVISEQLRYFAAAFSCKAPRMFDGSNSAAGCICSTDVAGSIFFVPFVILGQSKHSPPVTGTYALRPCVGGSRHITKASG
jgi:hypothetical protein